MVANIKEAKREKPLGFFYYNSIYNIYNTTYYIR